ncbi:GNAT family N-acetyltransferase [Sinimarinibacterium thermocellulolyticum]|uniref:N-acetyltransferase n=1 Tax=Sinimarinibacterium thermocellulolyticum TaxID=3170016 RepID=A0ABV2A9I4_9GAMM
MNRALRTARVRRARAEDAAGILALEQHFPGDRMSARSVRHLLRAASACVRVACLDGAVVGAVILLLRRNSRWARIYSVAVDPRWRGLGIGRRLVLAAEADARRLGRDGVTLEVREDNAAARALYENLGYRIDAVLPGYYEDGAPGIRLRKPFAPPLRSGR